MSLEWRPENAIPKFAEKVEAIVKAVSQDAVAAVHQSIVEGSPVTGSPGQPVGQYGPGYHPEMVGHEGTLKGSWQVNVVSEWEGEIFTDVEYAVFIEHGGYTQRSTVGGPHSVAMTVNGWVPLVDHIAKTVVSS